MFGFRLKIGGFAVNKRRVHIDRDDRDDRIRRELAEFEERHEHREHREMTILKCGTSTGSGPLPVNRFMDEDVRRFRPIVQATVVLDTHDLIEPTVKIDFSSLITFKTSNDKFLLNIMFKLSKICHEEERIPLGTWTFEEAQGEKKWETQYKDDKFVQETESFCFTWCEDDVERSERCRYIVEIIDLQSINIDFAIVSNVSLTAMAVGEKRR
jgi:hypothetical protein